ncbi:LysR family transcriptional regulator [Tamilnaduibacter salinus]|uniref:LysR family transcriptional regulator n=1 Tax=Tamilnaduibacter salinus TaxID=1484056 RepID=A0A2A2I355_9GAMM|nr:LysR family transcriptional regulator [Tamilnaduibacter salinus]PAV26149.1 LysR family transcriptional regulator [Tamilnaduibacter salinus]PVY70040.1 LysR family transcriptional regulator [Tamilnaduibacter salinus]
MNEQAMRWDDLQVVLAVAHTGSLSGAGRRLRVSHATVFRRLQDLEKRLGVRLFERSRGGYAPTLAGEDLATVAGRVQQEVHGAERRIAGQDLRLSGTIRVTTTDTLFAGLLAPLFNDFREQYPHISLEVVISNQRYSLSRREADIAIRPTNHPPDTLVGRRVTDIAQAVYGQRAQWNAAASPVAPESLRSEHWVGPDAHMGYATLEHWMADKTTSYRMDSMLGMQMAAREGSGIAVLPCYLGDQDDVLVRLSDPIEALATPLWLLTHPDLRQVTRIRTFMDAIADSVRARTAAM